MKLCITASCTSIHGPAGKKRLLDMLQRNDTRGDTPIVNELLEGFRCGSGSLGMCQDQCPRFASVLLFLCRPIFMDALPVQDFNQQQDN